MTDRDIKALEKVALCAQLAHIWNPSIIDCTYHLSGLVSVVH